MTLPETNPASSDLIDYRSKFSFWDALVLLGSAICLLWGLGTYNFYEPHEGHFAGVGREMILRGDWIVPHLNGAPYLNKPPAFYWMVGVSCKIFGINEWGARLPLALIGWTCSWLVWWWGRKLWNPAAGRTSVVLLSISAGWYLFSHQLLIDLLLATINVAVFITLWTAFKDPSKKRPWLFLYFLLGLSVFSKGFVGLVFPLTAGLFWIFGKQRKNLKAIVKAARLPYAVLIIFVVAAWWAIWVEIRNPGYLEYVIINEHWKRLFNERVPKDYNEMSVLAYWTVCFIWSAPVGFLVPALVSFIRREQKISTESSEQTNTSLALTQEEQKQCAVWLLAVGAAAPVVFFTFSPARLAYYGLPLVPLLAILASGWFTKSNNPEYKLGRIVSGLIWVVVGTAAFSAGFWAPPLVAEVPDMAGAPKVIKIIGPLSWTFGSGLFLGGLFLLLGRTSLSVGALFVILGGAGAFAVQGFAAYQDVRSSKSIVQKWDPKLGPETSWVFEGSREIGAAASISRYLEGKDPNGKPYRTTYVMMDSPMRPLPAFVPPKEKDYRLKFDQLEVMWAQDKPVVYITDFLRVTWTETDKPKLPGNLSKKDSFADDGRRFLFANKAAQALLKKQLEKDSQP